MIEMWSALATSIHASTSSASASRVLCTSRVLCIVEQKHDHCVPIIGGTTARHDTTDGGNAWTYSVCSPFLILHSPLAGWWLAEFVGDLLVMRRIQSGMFVMAGRPQRSWCVKYIPIQPTADRHFLRNPVLVPRRVVMRGKCGNTKQITACMEDRTAVS